MNVRAFIAQKAQKRLLILVHAAVMRNPVNQPLCFPVLDYGSLRFGGLHACIAFGPRILDLGMRIGDVRQQRAR